MRIIGDEKNTNHNFTFGSDLLEEMFYELDSSLDECIVPLTMGVFGIIFPLFVGICLTFA